MINETEKIWSQFSSQLVRFVKSKGIDENDALDIVQDVFIELEQKKKSIRNVSGWLFRVTRNQINDFFRHRARTNHSEIENVIDIYSQDDKQSFAKCIDPFIGTMSIQEQKLLQKQLAGASLKEIAKASSLPYSTIKSRALRTREKLRKHFLNCCQVKSMANLKETCADC